jgi:predicted transcriptional regulator
MNPKWVGATEISKAVGISPPRAAEILAALAEAEILESRSRKKERVYRRATSQVILSSAVDQAVFKGIHREGLTQAGRALEKVTVDRRFSATEMLSFKPSDFEKIKASLEESLDQIQQRCSAADQQKDSPSEKETFAVVLHLFPARGLT